MLFQVVYSAPEVLLAHGVVTTGPTDSQLNPSGPGQPTLAADVYALSCVLLEVMSGHPIFEGQHHTPAELARLAFDVVYIDKRPSLPAAASVGVTEEVRVYPLEGSRNCACDASLYLSVCFHVYIRACICMILLVLFSFGSFFLVCFHCRTYLTRVSGLCVANTGQYFIRCGE